MRIYYTFINAEPDQLELAKNAALTSVSVIMGGNIKMSEEMAAKERFVNEMKSLNVNSGLKEAVNALGSYAITANYFYDPAVTKEEESRRRFSSTCLYSSRTSYC